jgi:hypothetical protein
MVLDAGYKTPAIAKTLLDNGIKPIISISQAYDEKRVLQEI